MNYFLKANQNYANFKGRARRSEYWYFVLFNVIFSIAAMLIDRMLGTTIVMNLEGYGATPLPYGYIYIIFSLVMLIPGLAVSVRRLHDIGKSGWFILICLIPFVGFIWFLVLACTDSNVGINEYGPNPKGVGNHDEIDEIGSYIPQ